MAIVELSQVKHRLVVGIPLPFHVRNADQTLLLARGQLVSTDAQLRALINRGALVDTDDIAGYLPDDAAPPSLHDIRLARREALPGMYRQAVAQAHKVLNNPPTEGLDEAVEAISEPLMGIVERDPDLAIFQMLRQEGNYLTQYGVNHSIHCGITVFLVATRFNWSAGDIQRAFKAALTMNLSMLELQGVLATQSTPLSDAQRAEIHSHPSRSVEMLQAAGITDALWLNAIGHHHGDGEAQQAQELTALLQRSDVYTAKLSPRRNREALSADVAARMMFAADRGCPVTVAMVKEFGLYPPGCHVRLASGESGVVVQRGEQAHTPLVAVSNNARGAPLPEPVRRDTAQRPFSIASVLKQAEVKMHFTPERLLQAFA